MIRNPARALFTALFPVAMALAPAAVHRAWGGEGTDVAAQETQRHAASTAHGSIRVGDGSRPLCEGWGTYPRGTALRDGTLLALYDTRIGDRLELRVARSADRGASWHPAGVIASRPAEPGRSLANVFPLELEDGRILAAYRDHEQPGSEVVHRLVVSRSDATGSEWRPFGKIESNRDPSMGLWEPFLLHAPDGTLHAYYAREKAGGDQEIVLRRSVDRGRSWGDETIVASQARSRDGMPAAAVLNDGSLVVVFESFRKPGHPRFVVQAVQSNDAGRTWSQRGDVHVPEDANSNAGAPFLVRLPDGRLLASFMTDEGVDAPAWPHRAGLAVLLSEGIPAFGSLRWQIRPTPVESAPVYWPSLLVAGEFEVLALFDKSGPKARILTVVP